MIEKVSVSALPFTFYVLRTHRHNRSLFAQDGKVSLEDLPVAKVGAKLRKQRVGVGATVNFLSGR